MYPSDHPQAGRVVEFPVRVPSTYKMMVVAEDNPSCWARFHIEINEDGHARIGLVETSISAGLTVLECELLNGLAGIIARDILRQREVE